MSLAYDTKMEYQFHDSVEPSLAKFDIVVKRVSHNERTDVLDLTLQLPAGADRALRFEVLGLLANFEHDYDLAVVTNPTFIWAEEDDTDE